MLKSARSLLLGAMFTCLLSVGATGQAPISAAAYVSGARPNVNNGGAVILPVQQGVVSYVRFDLSKLPPAGCIGKVSLRLSVNAVLSPGMFEVREVNGGWDEYAIAAINAPSLGPLVGGSQPIPVSANSLYNSIQIDLTDLAQRWLSGKSPNNGIAIKLADESPADANFSFVGKVANNALAARLDPAELVCTDISVILPQQVRTCVKANDECTFDDNGAKKMWTDFADALCKQGKCENKAECVRKTDPQVVHQVINPDNVCVVLDKTKPKGCYAIAINDLQCKCK